MGKWGTTFSLGGLCKTGTRWKRKREEVKRSFGLGPDARKEVLLMHKKHGRGTRERLEQGDSVTGINIKIERGGRLYSGLGGCNRVW